MGKKRGTFGPFAAVMFFILYTLMYYVMASGVYDALFNNGIPNRKLQPPILLLFLMCVGILCYCYYTYVQTIAIMYRYRRMGSIRFLYGIILFFAPVLVLLFFSKS